MTEAAMVDAHQVQVDTRLVAGLPAIEGEADAAYLSRSLGRTGRPKTVGGFEVERLGGGRISPNVYALRSDAGAFVLKKFVPEPWRIEIFGTSFNEPALWVNGFTQDLPAPLTCPTIDVACHRPALYRVQLARQ